MRPKHFSRAWKKLCRAIPDIFWRKPMFAGKSSTKGNREQMRESARLSRAEFRETPMRNPLKRQTKQMRRGIS